MNRPRAAFAFIISGGLLIFLSPYLIHEAMVKHLPWTVPIIAIPIYAVLSYGAYRRFWPYIFGKARTNTEEKNAPDGRN
jgi:hypothetical protein